ncbi:phage capsid family protein [Andreesenia angusta]|uniref:Phage capsid family protein n=1 Tax=Andreesenia angusta TaxID=39480 RepID=A0A1S1V5K7_9FIRM|nr:phage major capsid protein [Andreesenia angusta]OHW61387.1 phage capsid family protein [Andreesenia angusta]
MNKRMREILEEINAKKEEARSLLNEKKVEEARAITNEVEKLREEFELESSLEEEERSQVQRGIESGSIKPEGVDEKRTFFKALRGEVLSEEERALVVGGTNEENLIVPQDINTQINELRRSYKSARELLNYYPTNTLTGSFVYEDATTITELVNFTDGGDVPGATDPKFKPVSYAVKEYGGLLPVSNVLLKNEAGGLISYIGNWFNKKAVKTENKKIFEVLQSNKTAKAIADWKALKKSINIDLDPELATDIVIVTNQDAFDVLDAALDGTGRPILQPNPTNPTQKMFGGYPVEVFSNALLPTTGTTTKKAPIFYGALKEGATFVAREGLEFATSEHAGFAKNQTLIRVIELFDVIQADKDAYVYGEITVS